MDTELMQNLCLNLVLLGRTGVGRSSSGNTILGREAFVSESSSTSVEHNVAVEIGNICGLPIKVYDTPGFSDTELSKEDLWKYEEILQKCETGLCAFLLVLQADIFTEEDQEALEKIEELLGAKRIQNTWILFTRGDELEEENKTINKVIKETEYLKNLVQKYEGRYHVFNNKHVRRHDEQVNSLASKIFYRNLETLPKRQRTSVNIPVNSPVNIPVNSPVNRHLSRRIVLLGKSGVGKSAAANTILGQREFESRVGSNSVTCESSVKHATVSGRKVSVVDTPGFFDTHMSSEQLMIEIARSVYISSPGPHAFIIVFPVNRFTQQEEEIPKIIEMLFGEEVLKYSMILFTHGDQLEGRSTEGIIEENEALRDLVDQCGGRYHVFNNKDENNREQVNDLLQKIDTMIEQNGGGHYSNQMFEDAYRFRREKEFQSVRNETEQRIRAEIQRENNERQEQVQIQRREEIERVRMMTEEKIRAECETQMRSEMRRLKVERQREEEERKQQEERKRHDEIERMKKQTQEKIRAEIQYEINLRQQDEKKKRQEEIERVRMMTEEKIRAECETQMRSEMRRLKVERQREEEERKQQEERKRHDEIERMKKQTQEKIRAEIQYEINLRQQDEKKKRQEEIERVRMMTEEKIRAECETRMRSEMRRLKVERQREEEERKQQEERKILDEIERVKKQTEEKIRAEIQYEINLRQQDEKKKRQEEIERVRMMTEERIRAECEARMMSEMGRLKVERQREEEERKQQEERKRHDEIERVKRQTQERIRAECEARMRCEMRRLKVERQREEEDRKQKEEKKKRQEEIERVKKQRNTKCEEGYGFKEFFSKYWKHFLMGIAAGAIIGGVVGGAVGGAVGGIVGGVVGLIVGKRQGHH